MRPVRPERIRRVEAINRILDVILEIFRGIGAAVSPSFKRPWVVVTLLVIVVVAMWAVGLWLLLYAGAQSDPDCNRSVEAKPLTRT